MMRSALALGTCVLAAAVAAVLVLRIHAGSPMAPAAAPMPPRQAPTYGGGVPGGALMAKSILMVIAQKDFRDEELATPRQTFEKAGAKVTVAAPSKERAKGMLGAVVDPDLALADANVGDYDAVVFVGGSGAQSLYDDTTAQALAQATVKADKVLGAICLAPGILARAGLLNGKSCTVWKSEAGSLRAAGANYKDEAVVVDGKLVTGNGPEAAQEFADALVKTLGQSSEGALTPQAPPAAPPTGRPPAR